MRRHNLLGPSSSVVTGSTPPPAHHIPRRPRRRRSPGPSSSWSAFFVTVVASASPAESRPFTAQATPPPDFLCPHFGNISCRNSFSAPTSSLPPQSSVTPVSVAFTQQVPRSASVADKFVQGDDKRWRKTDMWSLYGSTICMASECSAVPISTVQIAESASSSYTSSTFVHSSSTPSLPSGWPTKPKDDNVTTPVIVTLSLVLALCICSIITLCVMWRKKRRLKARSDLEKRARKDSLGDDSDNESEELKHFRSKQRIWAKATARWKANIRHSVRRRRKHAASGPKDTGFRTLVETCQNSQSSASLPRTADSHDSAGYEAVNDISSSLQSHDPVNAHVIHPPSPTSSPTQPPAYLSNSPAVCDDLAYAHCSQNLSPYPNLNDTTPSSSVSEGANPDIEYQESFRAAHVATDDKAVLARIASMASAPPSTDLSSPEELTVSYASVPALDDEFEDLPFGMQVSDTEPGASRSLGTLPPAMSHEHVDVPSYSCDVFPQPSLLPPPPMKALAASMFYEYPSSFEEDYCAEPEAHPSAPPFEVESSAVPSAPPLELDFESGDVGGLLPSAPPLDDEVTARGSALTAAPREPADRGAESSSSASAMRRAPSPSWSASPPRYLP
ncbi:hypothetical protein BKA93DRAFT_249706 [Sparassis latifolia]